MYFFSKRKDLKLWTNQCDMCCNYCKYNEKCIDECVRHEITCNQCKYEEDFIYERV